jgi:hypothetical protein
MMMLDAVENGCQFLLDMIARNRSKLWSGGTVRYRRMDYIGANEEVN